MTGRDSRFRLPPAGSFLWVFVAAIVLRGVYLWEVFQRNELIAYPVVDEAAYLQWARDIVAGHWLWYEPTNYTPGHPFWLAGWLSLLGWRPAAHFAVFLLLGAVQAVLVGRTAEMIWHRRAGLLAGWLAALYWPLIIFEASYFAEPFATFNLTLAVFLVLRWQQVGGAVRLLFWAGFCLGWSVLVRANAMLCIPVFIGWILWESARGFPAGWWRQSIAAALLFVLPLVLMLSPVLYWNWKIAGRPMLRTQGWLSVYVGNEPAFQGRAVPAGARWIDLTYRPIRAGSTDANAKESYWRDETLRVIRERTGEWAGLLERKGLMQIGRFEISQEIDVPMFRAASHVLSWPIWPGWGTVLPLALCGLVAMFFSREARRGWLLALCFLAYFGSIMPVQAAGRYRLPAVVLLLPLAGWAGIAIVDAFRRRDTRVLAGMLTILGVGVVLVVPDWLSLRQAKIVNHWFLIGLKRGDAGDAPGAYAAFARGAEWNPNDPDCPLRMARIAFDWGDRAQAEQLYQQTLKIFPASHEAILGLGECALFAGHADEALQRVQEAMQIAPNNLDALALASRIFAAKGEWRAMAIVCRQMRSYPTHPASVDFAEARAWILAGQPAEALPLYDAMAAAAWRDANSRAEASLLGGILAWQTTGQSAEALRRWSVAENSRGLFGALAATLVGRETPAALRAALPQDLSKRSALYVEYTSALEARLHGRAEDERHFLEAVIAIRDARQLLLGQRDLLEIWALSDLERLK